MTASRPDSCVGTLKPIPGAASIWRSLPVPPISTGTVLFMANLSIVAAFAVELLCHHSLVATNAGPSDLWGPVLATGVGDGD